MSGLHKGPKAETPIGKSGKQQEYEAHPLQNSMDYKIWGGFYFSG